jgi:Carbohydrate family 9 binding domain-like
MRVMVLIGLLAVAHATALAQRHYICYFTATPPVIDGRGDDPVWERAPWTEDFTDIEGDLRPDPPLRTRAKLLWDSNYLYIYGELQEPDLWGTLRRHDTIIYLDNDFEVFIDPDNSTHNYFELEFNTLGTEMDLFMAKPYRNGGKALMSWDAQGLRSAVFTRGTLNTPGDVDSGWSIEIAIPLETLRFFGERPVRDSSLWRINFSRVEWDRDVAGGVYVPRVNTSTGRRLPEHNWVWSPQGIIDMHAPEHWGYLFFSVRKGGEDTVVFTPPADEKARGLLWMVYNGQRNYFKEHGNYAVNLQALGINEELTDAAGTSYKLKMEGTAYQFMAMLSSSGLARKLSIDQDGLVTVY